MSFDRPAGGNPDLKRLLSGIETPPLIAMPPDHVLTKSFYLLSDMPGRWQRRQGLDRVGRRAGSMTASPPSSSAPTTMPAPGRSTSAAAASYPVTPGGETQREMSFRVGVNLVMHALTGNYKDDQVHMPDIMQRLRR